MGKKSAPQPPPAPDPYELIDAQKKANRIDTFTPFGSTTYDTVNGKERSTSQVSGQLEPILNQILTLSQRKSGSDTAFTDAMFNQAQGLIDRDFGLRENQFRNRLSNRGLPVGSEAYSDAFRTEIADPRQQAIESAAFNAIRAGDQREQTQTAADFNRLLSILNGFQPVATPQVNALGPFQLNQNAKNAAYQADLAQYNNRFNVFSQLGSAFLFGL